MSELKELRLQKNMTQKQVAEEIGISLRSYKMYENEKDKIGTLKYQIILQKLNAINPLDEEHGLLSINEIKEKCKSILEKYDINFGYLFGSYAKGKATATSDVDLLLDTTVTGIKFFGLVEELREVLHKKVDVLDTKQLNQNTELVCEVLKDGIKIYG